MTKDQMIRELDQKDPKSLRVTPPGPLANTSSDEPLPWDSVIRHRGFEVTRYHSGPWDVTHQWAKEGWDLGDPIGYEQTVADCLKAIDEWIADEEPES